MIFGIVFYLFGLSVTWGLYLMLIPNHVAFAVLFAATFFLNLPGRALSPLSLFYGYYGVWFVAAPMLAERYEGTLEQPEYILAVSMAYTIFGIGVICINFGERLALRFAVGNYVRRPASATKLRLSIFILYCFATVMIYLIINFSGGMEKWLIDPGDAFLNRSGTGVFVILSHFSSILLAALSGYYAHVSGRKYPVVLFVAWLLVTSPVHGSKLQISLLAIIAFLPWIRSLRLLSLRAALLYCSMLFIFLMGLYFRNMSWVGFETILPYAFNYFTALENLAISLRDFPPSLLTTFFMPFAKFQTPFGLSDPHLYYDMNHMLTDLYYPSAWEIRATEQWPVETDMYLNFMFFAGIPFVGLYLFCIGVLYGRAIKVDSFGLWLASTLMTVFMISHLRGSLINHTDFYVYPYIVLVYVLLRGFSFRSLRALTPGSFGNNV